MTTTEKARSFSAREMAIAYREIAEDVREFWLGAWTYGNADYVVEPLIPTRA